MTLPQDCLSSAFAFFIGAAALLCATINIVRYARDADVVDLAVVLERGGDPGSVYLAAFVAAHDDPRAKFGCGDSASRARLTVALAALRDAERASEIPLISVNRQYAVAAVDARLRCAPTDGNAWLQWSRLAERAAGPGSQAIEGVRRSQRFAPAEAWILAQRLDVEAEMGAAKLEPSYSADLKRFVAFEPPIAVAGAYVGHVDTVRARIRPLIAAAPEPGRSAIIAAIDRLGVEFPRP